MLLLLLLLLFVRAGVSTLAFHDTVSGEKRFLTDALRGGRSRGRALTATILEAFVESLPIASKRKQKPKQSDSAGTHEDL